MDILDQIDTANLHHAYLIEDDEGVFGSLQEHLKREHQGAEIHIREFETLGIDDSRALIHLASMRSLGTQLFIYRARSCTREAQNALLKLFEDPPERTHFFFCLTRIGDILPTLRSRVWVIENAQNSRVTNLGEKFVAASMGKRVSLLEQIVKNKDITAANTLLQDIELELHALKKHTKFAHALQHVIDVRRVLHDKGASLKVLMESVALVTPKLS